MLSTVFVNAGSLRRFVAGLAVLGAVAAPSLASAQMENFESKVFVGACQSNGGAPVGFIGDKEWVGFNVLDLNNYVTKCGYGTHNGYGTLGSAVVGEVLALGAGTAYVHSLNPFVLTSMVAGAGWQNPTSLTLASSLNGKLMDTRTIQLSTYADGLSSGIGYFTGLYAGATDFIGFTPTYAADNAAHTSDVFSSRTFCTSANAPGCSNGRYESWFVDNMSFTPATVVVTPEPATVGMIGFGLLALGLVGRKRRKA